MIKFLTGRRVVLIWTSVSVMVLESTIKPCFYHAECGGALVGQCMHGMIAEAWVWTIFSTYVG